jgi:hypothetical protein
MILYKSVTMVHSLYRYYCPFSTVYLVYTTFRELDPLPTSGKKVANIHRDGDKIANKLNKNRSRDQMELHMVP